MRRYRDHYDDTASPLITGDRGARDGCGLCLWNVPGLTDKEPAECANRGPCSPAYIDDLMGVPADTDDYPPDPFPVLSGLGAGATPLEIQIALEAAGWVNIKHWLTKTNGYGTSRLMLEHACALRRYLP